MLASLLIITKHPEENNVNLAFSTVRASSKHPRNQEMMKLQSFLLYFSVNQAKFDGPLTYDNSSNDWNSACLKEKHQPLLEN